LRQQGLYFLTRVREVVARFIRVSLHIPKQSQNLMPVGGLRVC
jgi:hypothetical protein